MSMSRYFHGRFWYFCTKCGHNGRWVCTHHDGTHRSSLLSHSNDCNRDYSRYQCTPEWYQNRYYGYHSSNSIITHSNSHEDHHSLPIIIHKGNQVDPDLLLSIGRHLKSIPEAYKCLFVHQPLINSMQNLSLLDSINAFIGTAGTEK